MSRGVTKFNNFIIVFVGVAGLGEIKDLRGVARGFTASRIYFSLSGLNQINYLPLIDIQSLTIDN